jgi:hypothetical protein
MIFENMSVKRMILHEVFQRKDDKLPIPPRYGGHLIQLPADAMDDFKTRVIDALGNNSKRMEMTISDGAAAAQYFYEAFLGCVIPQNSSFLTKAFFDHTKEFIKGLSLPPEKRADLLTGLYTYLKVDNAPTLSVNAFSKNFLPRDTADDFEAFMKQKNFPLGPFKKTSQTSKAC